MFTEGQQLEASVRITREGLEKPYYRTIGKAWVNTNKETGRPYISIKLDVLPMDGDLRLNIEQPRKDGGAKTQGPDTNRQRE
jgi:uncharacterized protein (DUF736 family)